MKIHIKSSWENIRRSPFQALAALIILVETFFVATLIVFLAYGSNKVVNYFESRPQIIAFLKDEATPDQISNLQDKLSNDNRVHQIRIVTKEEALSIYKDATSENPLLGELVSPSIFPASIEFSVNDLSFAEDLVNEMKKEEIIDTIGFTASVGGESSLGEVISRLRNIALYIRVGGVAAISLLGLTSFLVLVIIFALRIATRKKDIDNLSLIGATPGFIRAPIVFEAINYAVIGSFFGWFFAILIILYATPDILKFFAPIEVLPKNTQSLGILLGATLAAEMLSAIFIAIISSFFAVGRALKLVK